MQWIKASEKTPKSIEKKYIRYGPEMQYKEVASYWDERWHTHTGVLQRAAVVEWLDQGDGDFGGLTFKLHGYNVDLFTTPPHGFVLGKDGAVAHGEVNHESLDNAVEGMFKWISENTMPDVSDPIVQKQADDFANAQFTAPYKDLSKEWQSEWRCQRSAYINAYRYLTETGELESITTSQPQQKQ